MKDVWAYLYRDILALSCISHSVSLSISSNCNIPVSMQGPTIGDVDGDGHTDVVVPTSSGKIYVLKGTDGSFVGPYPFKTHGRVMAPVLLVDLSNRGADRKGLTIAVTSFDGYFYLIDGPTGCADAIDIGETS